MSETQRVNSSLPLPSAAEQLTRDAQNDQFELQSWPGSLDEMMELASASAIELNRRTDYMGQQVRLSGTILKPQFDDEGNLETYSEVQAPDPIIGVARGFMPERVAKYIDGQYIGETVAMCHLVQTDVNDGWDLKNTHHIELIHVLGPVTQSKLDLLEPPYDPNILVNNEPDLASELDGIAYGDKSFEQKIKAIHELVTQADLTHDQLTWAIDYLNSINVVEPGLYEMISDYLLIEENDTCEIKVPLGRGSRLNHLILQNLGWGIYTAPDLDTPEGFSHDRPRLTLIGSLVVGAAILGCVVPVDQDLVIERL